MKKHLTNFLIVLLFFPMMAGTENLIHVSDLANVLNTQEEAVLEDQASELFHLTGFDIILHTTNNSQNKGPMNYSFDYYHAFRDAASYPDGAMLAILFDTRDYYEAARGSGINLLTHRESYDLGNVVEDKLSVGDYFGAMSDYLMYVKDLISPFALTTIENGIRPIGAASRKNPLLVGQKVLTEVNMYNEYKYSYTIEYKGFTRDKNSITINLFLSISKCSDDVDRDINLWSSDFELFDNEFSQISLADQINSAKSEAKYSRNILMFPETSNNVIIMFDNIPDGSLYLRFNPTNSYKFDDKSIVKSSVWFAVEP